MSLNISSRIRRCKNALHGIFPFLATIRYGKLGNRMTVIGITGTDGKSSSVILTAAILRAAGNKVAHFSSVSFHDGITESINEKKMTTPGYMQLHTFLNKALKNGCTYAVLEITSQGILQHRHKGIGFSLVGITNITPEHIEAHGGFEPYQSTKLSLLKELKKDNKGLVIEKGTYERVKNRLPKSVAVHVVNDLEETVSTTHLGGPFAVRNCAFAATVASLYGASLEVIKTAFESLQGIPGRFEVISQRPLVIVDYAHTLEALRILLPHVRAQTSGKLIHVFGAAGGGRDRYKRPLLAQLSEQYTDVSIVTEENSFDEPVEHIISDIRSGFSSQHIVYEKPHREDAVVLGKSLLTSEEDTLLLTAKGSETVIAGPRGIIRPYNERAYIKWLFETSSSD